MKWLASDVCAGFRLVKFSWLLGKYTIVLNKVSKSRQQGRQRECKERYELKVSPGQTGAGSTYSLEHPNGYCLPQ